MAADEPPYLTVGTDVSAKYKGAFCEAKVKKVNRLVKCKVNFKNNQGTTIVTDDQIKGTLRVGAHVEVKLPEKSQPMEAVISKLFDYSQYTVVFDDGDETTLRRTSLCLKSGRHFAESETLDQLPLTNPEHFGTPVMGSKTKRKRRSATAAVAVMNFQRARRAHSSPIFASLCRDEESSDEDPPMKKTKETKQRERDPDIGKVVCVEVGDKRRKDSWFPGLVVSPMAQESIKICMKDDYLVRSFKDGKYYSTLKKDTKEFTKEISSKIDSTMLKTAVEKALQYLDNDELPPHWDRDLLMGLNVPSTAEVTDTDSDQTSDDEPSEEKDRFVAQLYKFMDERGTPINKAPTVGNRDLNLYKLFKLVSKMGGYNKVTNQNQWKTVYTKMGLPASNPSSSHQIKQAYKKYLHSFEDFYRKLGCTMVNNIRSSRARHRSDRNFMITRNRDRETSVTKSKQKDQSAKEKARSDEKSKDDGEDEEDEEEEEEDDDGNEDGEEVEQEANTADDEREDDEKEEAGSLSPSAIDDNDDADQTKEEEDIDEDDDDEEAEDAVKKSDGSDLKDVKVMCEKQESTSESSNKVDKVQKDREHVFKAKPDKVPKDKDWKSGSRKDRKVLGKEEKRKMKKDVVDDKERKGDRKDKQDRKDRQKKDKQPKEAGIDLKEVERKDRRKDSDAMSLDSVNLTAVAGKQRGKGADPKKDDRNIRSKSSRRDGSPMVKKQVKRMNSRTDDRGFDSEGKSKSGNDDSDRNDSSSSSEKNDKPTKADRDMSSVQIGDRVKVRYGARKQQKIYEAKVVKMDDERGFYVHYTGWNMRYDEWVKKSRIVEIVTDKPTVTKKKKKQPVGVIAKQSIQVNRVYKRGRTTNMSAGKAATVAPPPSMPSASGQLSGGSSSRKSSVRSTSPSPVTKSRSMRSDRNSLSESPFASGLEPRKRVRRKSGVSITNQDSFQSLENLSEPGASDTEDTSKDGMQVDDDDNDNGNLSDERTETLSAGGTPEPKEESSKKRSDSDDSTEEESTPTLPELVLEVPPSKDQRVGLNDEEKLEDDLPPPPVMPKEPPAILEKVQTDDKELLLPEVAPITSNEELPELENQTTVIMVPEASATKLPERMGNDIIMAPVEEEKLSVSVSEIATLFPAVQNEDGTVKEETVLDNSAAEIPMIAEVVTAVAETQVDSKMIEDQSPPECENMAAVKDSLEPENVKDDVVVKSEDVLASADVLVVDQVLTIVSTEEMPSELSKVASTDDEAIYNELVEINKKLGMSKESEDNDDMEDDDDDDNHKPVLTNGIGVSESSYPPTLPLAPALEPIDTEMVEEDIQEEEEFPLLVMDTSKIAQVQEEIKAEKQLMSPLSSDELLELPSIEDQEKPKGPDAADLSVESEQNEPEPALVAPEVTEQKKEVSQQPLELSVPFDDIKEPAAPQLSEEPVVPKASEELGDSVCIEEQLCVLSAFDELANAAEMIEKKDAAAAREQQQQGNLKKEGKRDKKPKTSKEKKHPGEVVPEKPDSKKTIKHRVKRKLKTTEVADSEGNKEDAKMKMKKAKKFKSKKPDSEEEKDNDTEAEKKTKKEKRKREEKKVSRTQSDGEKDDCKKEKKKARKNRERMLLADKKRDESLEKRPKKKKKLYVESDVDVDGDKDGSYLSSESPTKLSRKEKRREKKKIKEVDNQLDDEGNESMLQDSCPTQKAMTTTMSNKQMKSVIGSYAPLVAATGSERKDEEYDQGASFLLCEEKVPASPVPDEMLVEFTDQPPLLSFANTVKSQPSSTTSTQGGTAPAPATSMTSSGNTARESSELPYQPEVLGGGNALESAARHESEVSSVLDNTPPTTPESTESVASNSPPHEHERACIQEARSSGESTEEESSYVQQERPAPMEPVESEDGSSRTESTVSSGSIAHEKSKDSLSKSNSGGGGTKRHKPEAQDEGVQKRRKTRKRNHSLSEVIPRTANTRHRNNSSRSGKDGDECSTNGLSECLTSDGVLGSSLSNSTSMNLSTNIPSFLINRPSKFHFCDPIDDCTDADKRIAVLQERLAELRKTYMALKAEVALIDRRRKKAKKKEKETAASTLASVSAGTHSVEVHCTL